MTGPRFSYRPPASPPGRVSVIAASPSLAWFRHGLVMVPTEHQALLAALSTASAAIPTVSPLALAKAQSPDFSPLGVDRAVITVAALAVA